MVSNVPSIDCVFKIFRQLNRIPRPSHHEGRVSLYLTRFAEKLGLEYEQDEENNVVIRKPATPGYEKAEPIVLLNHMDMVCVSADGVGYDPLHDSIKPVIEDGWMHAEGTSLGADNGIGLSMALAILQDDSIKHGPLEVLTTTNEEDGMTGAAALSPDFIKGRKVINLDSEDYSTITVGAAGACIQETGMRARRMKTPLDLMFYTIKVSGGLGGHSGVDINKGRTNVLLLMLDFLLRFSKMQQEWYCASLEIGNAAASIPSSGTITVAVPQKVGIPRFKTMVKTAFAISLQKKCEKKDSNIHLSLTKAAASDTVIDPEDTQALLHLLPSLPNGVLKMRKDMSDVVETSSNLGVLRANQHFFDIFIHSRSFSIAEQNAIAEQIDKLFTDAGGMYKRIMNVPSWEENSDSSYMHMVEDTFKDVLGFLPKKVAMHFVLEAGYYVEKYPGIQIACIGPRIVEPHSPSERVELSTVEDIWKVTVELLARLADQ